MLLPFHSEFKVRTNRMPGGSGSVSLSDFEILYTIGSGSYGTCKKVKRKRDGKVFVWKEMDYGAMTEDEKKMLVSEVNLLRELRHENIVKYHERIIDKRRQILYLIMEYCEGGDLAAVIKRYQRDGRYFPEDMIWRVLAQCSLALNECHKRKDGKSILHRDLKPANIFLDAHSNVKLGDFGLARVLHHETSFAKTFVGTPYYMSPEQMNKDSYNEKSDIWSLGCVLYEMCTLHPPFLASNQRELALKIRVGRFSPISSRYSSELNRVISKMLNTECRMRPSIEELLKLTPVSKHIPVIPPTPSEPTAVTNGSNSEKEKQLRERESALVQLELRLHDREKLLTEREKKLEHLEDDLKIKEIDLEMRRKSIEEREEKLRSRDLGLNIRESLTVNDNKVTENTEEIRPLTPILCKAKKLLDSPSKRVSFQDEKENQCYVLGGHVVIDAEARRRELRERLEKAKHRAAQLRSAEYESKLKSRQLLMMR